MWWTLAAAAAPYVASMFQSKPDRPGAPAPVQTKNRDREIDMMMDTANNPNSEQWKLASDQVGDQVNRLLGRTGMAGGSVGAQLQQGTQAKLAQSWLENQAQRQNQAMNVALNYDAGRAGIARGNADAEYRHAMDGYDAANKANANQIAGISNMINAGVGAYNQQQMMDRYDQMIAAQNPQAMYGVPGGDVTHYSIYGGSQGGGGGQFMTSQGY